jgi:uncharacterized phiE125 gp8 family phage protein
MPVRRTGQPAEEPITLAEAKQHLRVDDTGDATDDAVDAEIEAFISAAREMAEARMGRSIISTEWTLTLDSFPCEIELPNPRAIAVLDLLYTDVDGVEQTMDPATYVLDNAGELRNWIETAADYDWPDTSTDTINNVRVVYTAGWANAAAVPAPIKAWIKLAVGTWFKQREVVITGTVNTLPREFFDSLLDPYRAVLF